MLDRKLILKLLLGAIGVACVGGVAAVLLGHLDEVWGMLTGDRCPECGRAIAEVTPS